MGWIRIAMPALAAVIALGSAYAAQIEDFPAGVRDTLGPRFAPRPHLRGARPAPSVNVNLDALVRLRHWNRVAIDASGLDHTPVAPGETRTFGEQLGPGRSSRAMAIVHIAMFDAVNAIAPTYQSYTGVSAAHGASMDAAIAQAAHDALTALYPSQRAALDALLADDLAQIAAPTAFALARGSDLGRRAAAAILALRADDGSQFAEPRVGIDYITSDAAGQVAPGPDRPVSACARRRMGGRRAVRAALLFAVPRASASADVEPALHGGVSGGKARRR